MILKFTLQCLPRVMAIFQTSCLAPLWVTRNLTWSRARMRAAWRGRVGLYLTFTGTDTGGPGSTTLDNTLTGLACVPTVLG